MTIDTAMPPRPEPPSGTHASGTHASGKPASILVADDDRGIRVVLVQALTRLGHTVQATAEATTLWSWVQAGAGDLVITDVRLPDGNGLDLVPQIRTRRPDLPVIVMTAHSTLSVAVQATERGAFDYLAKPFDIDALIAAVERAIRHRTDLAPAAAAAADDGDPPDQMLPLIGRSAAMQEIYRVLARLMATDMTVLVTGESGTGKELIARALHQYGRRAGGPFIPVNMAAIPRELIESELFGHERGAFTGAHVRHPGRFEQAAGGTLFLDEIGDMPLEAQTRLLRVLQEGEFTTVGGRSPVRADVRIVAATHRDLLDRVHQGQFREDLYYRLNVVPIRIPPLRERREDIPDLVSHFFRKIDAEGRKIDAESISAAATTTGGAGAAEREPRRLAADAFHHLTAHAWPGNVRELENLIRRFAVLHPESVIDAATVATALGKRPGPGGPAAETMTAAAPARTAPATRDDASSLAEAVATQLARYFQAHVGGLPPAGLYDTVIREVERPLLSLTLEATGGNQVKAAQVLGLNRNTLRKKIRDLDIPVMRGLK